MSRTARPLVLVALLFGACSSESSTPVTDGEVLDPACNGHEELCGRQFDKIAIPMAHNAMSNDEAGWSIPNQRFGITRQLDDGIRGLMLDTYEEDGELLLCHVLCGLGKQSLVEGLGEIQGFLDANPRELVSIIFENYITHTQTADAFNESGLIDFVYAHEVGAPWPTLGELIDAGTRLIVFQENLPQSVEFPWLMNIWDHAGETDFSFATPEDFDCDPNRGDPANPLFIDRARQCEEERSALPNFVAVDFYDTGDLFSLVNALNGL